MWKNAVGLDRPQMTIWRMRCAYWAPKATNTHSEYVIIIAFPLQRWLHERAALLRYTTSQIVSLLPSGKCQSGSRPHPSTCAAVHWDSERTAGIRRLQFRSIVQWRLLLRTGLVEWLKHFGLVSGEHVVADCQDDRRSVNKPGHSVTNDTLYFDMHCVGNASAGHSSVIKWLINKYLITL
jgi:hypothetical protein